MKIALVNCPAWNIEFPPYSIALISAELRQKDIETQCFDFNRDMYLLTKEDKYLWDFSNLYSFWLSKDNIEKLFCAKKDIINNFIMLLRNYEIIGFSIQSLNYIFSIELAGSIKKLFPEKFIIAGGPECFNNFNAYFITQQECFDAVCLGEGDIALPELMCRIKNKQQIDTAGFVMRTSGAWANYREKNLVQNLNELPYADYSFLEADAEKAAISTSRGCINNCTFCCEKSHWHGYRYRNAESVIDEIILLKERFPRLNFVYLNDSLVNGNMREFEKFCDLMIDKNLCINWGGHILARKEMSFDFMKKMFKAGAQHINYGIESGSDTVLRLMRKSFNKNIAMDVLENTQKANISFSVNLIIGHPGEGEKEFNETLELYGELKKLTATIHLNPCIVLKGSDLFMNHEKWGIVLPENYVTDWYMADGSNNLEIRNSRINKLLRYI